jgi:hypothetical protein
MTDSDLIDRLRNRAHELAPYGRTNREAADMIEALRAVLRDYVKEYPAYKKLTWINRAEHREPTPRTNLQDRARALLENTQ